MRKKILVLVFVVSMISLASSVTAQAIITETFSDYSVEIEILSDGSAHVINRITIRNAIAKAIIPGEGYIKLTKSQENMIWIFPTGSSYQKFQELSDLKVYDTNGNKLNGRADFFPNETIITYEIWTPIEPGQTYSFVIEYNTPDLIAPGVLFTSGATPEITSSVPIEKSSLKVNLPRGVYISYAPGVDIETDSHITLSSDDISALSFEYTGIPFGNMPIRGSTIFWSFITLIIIGVYFGTKYLITQFDIDAIPSVTRKDINFDLSIRNKTKKPFAGSMVIELFNPEKICVYTGRKSVKIRKLTRTKMRIARKKDWVSGKYLVKALLVDKKEKKHASETIRFKMT